MLYHPLTGINTKFLLINNRQFYTYDFNNYILLQFAFIVKKRYILTKNRLGKSRAGKQYENLSYSSSFAANSFISLS